MTHATSSHRARLIECRVTNPRTFPIVVVGLYSAHGAQCRFHAGMAGPCVFAVNSSCMANGGAGVRASRAALAWAGLRAGVRSPVSHV
nr:hypothetical protein [Paraburkholderia unamae]